MRSGEAVELRASGSIRPYLLAALLDSEEALAGRPALVVAPDDVGARDLARSLGAYLAPRRVRYYPSRGHRLRVPPRPAAAPGRAADRGAARRSSARARGPARRRSSSPARSRSPRRFPTRRSARAASRSSRGEEIDLATSPSCSSRPATSGSTRSRSVASSRSAATSSTSSRATEERAARLELFGDEIESIRWFSTFTQRSLGDAERDRARPGGGARRSSTASSPSIAAGEEPPSDRASPSCCRSTASSPRWS